jgi:hypothetical protein
MASSDTPVNTLLLAIATAITNYKKKEDEL